MNLKQADLALASGIGLRFISDLENGEETRHMGKVLAAGKSLGLELSLEAKEAR